VAGRRSRRARGIGRRPHRPVALSLRRAVAARGTSSGARAARGRPLQQHPSPPRRRRRTRRRPAPGHRRLAGWGRRDGGRRASARLARAPPPGVRGPALRPRGDLAPDRERAARGRSDGIRHRRDPRARLWGTPLGLRAASDRTDARLRTRARRRDGGAFRQRCPRVSRCSRRRARVHAERRHLAHRRHVLLDGLARASPSARLQRRDPPHCSDDVRARHSRRAGIRGSLRGGCARLATPVSRR
jgi:hypothetical protein